MGMELPSPRGPLNGHYMTSDELVGKLDVQVRVQGQTVSQIDRHDGDGFVGGS